MRLIDSEPIERELLKYADKAIGKNPYEKASICAYRRACELLLNAPTIASPPNPPLALAELRGMDGEPVWVEFLYNKAPRWMLVNTEDDDVRSVYTSADFECYGKQWLAYRRKPEGA